MDKREEKSDDSDRLKHIKWKGIKMSTYIKTYYVIDIENLYEKVLMSYSVLPEFSSTSHLAANYP